jgi:hypothetical protein
MMALSTETEVLLEFYNQKIELDTKQVSQINVIETGYNIQTGIETTDKLRIYGPQELIDNYNVPIKKIDAKILEYNNQIRTLQEQILSLGQEANSIGCGTMTSPIWVDVDRDDLNYTGYGFSAPNPFSPLTGTIDVETVGLGTMTDVVPVGIGSYNNNNLSTCYDIGFPFTCSNTICAGYATSITNINAEIDALKALRDPLIIKVNTLKEGRISFQLQKYAYDQSKVKLNEQLQKTEAIITFLQDPANDEWL